MSFVARLLETHKDRVAALKEAWGGPLNYNPSNFFDAMEPHIPLRSHQYSVISTPWFAVSAFAIIWTCLMKLLERFHTISPQGIVQPQDLTSLDNCLTWVQISMTFLITFRLNRAAVRYYESRAFCGKLVEMCRSLATHYVTYYEEDEGRDECLRWVLAYPVAVKNYLRGEEGSVMELLGILDHAQAKGMLEAKHQPLYCLSKMRSAAYHLSCTARRNGMMAAITYQVITNEITILYGAMGGMERINNTPLPWVYVTHLRFLVLIFCIGMPIIELPKWGWMTIPTTMILSFAFMGADAAATECERPFKKRRSHLNLEQFCIAVVENVLQIMQTTPTCRFLQEPEEASLTEKQREDEEFPLWQEKSGGLK